MLNINPRLIKHEPKTVHFQSFMVKIENLLLKNHPQ